MKVATVQVNYYEILGVEPTARLEEIRNAYKKLCLKMHPDRALINKELEMKRKMGDHEVEGVPEGDEQGAHVDDTVDRRGRGTAAASEEEAGAGEAGAAAAAPGSSPSSTSGSSSSSSCSGGKKGTQEQGAEAERTSNSSATSSAAPTMKNEEAGNSSSSTSSRPKKTAARNSVSSPVDGCEGGSRGGGATKGKVNIEFYQVQDAWKTLSNPSRRFLYDMRNFGKSEEFPECDESYLLDLERAQAEKDLHQMGSYLTKVVTRETRAKGVIIMDAWYGDMSILSKFYLAFNEKSSPNRVGEDGLYVDVRVATQCQVDYKSHRLIMSGGDSTSRSDLPGYYNPIPLSLRNSVELGLFIRYQFNDEVHEVLANDTEPIYIPKKSHTISNIAKRIRQEQEHEEQLRQAGVGAGAGGNGKNFIPSKIKKVLTGGSDKKQPMGDRVIACHLGLCALFAGLYLYKERDVLKNVLAEVCGWKTDRVLEFVDGGKVRVQI